MDQVSPPADNEAVLRQLSEAVGKDPQDASAWSALGIGLLDLERAKEALDPLIKATSLDASNATAWVYLGLAQLQTSQLESAVQSFRRARTLDAGVVAAWIGEADVHAAQGSFDEALKVLDQAESADPQHGTKIGVLSRRGSWLNNLSRYAPALVSIDRALALISDADDIKRVSLERGVALNGLDRPKEALLALRDAMPFPARDERLGVIHLHEAIALNATGEPEQALAAAQQAEAWLTDGPGLGSVLFQKGLALNGLKRWEDAVRCFERAWNLLAGDAPGLVFLAGAARVHAGLALNVLGRHAESVTVLEPALAQIAQSPLAFLGRNNYSIALEAVGRLGDAEAALSQALQAQPPVGILAALWGRKGRLLLTLERWAEAVEALNEAARLDPNLESMIGFWSSRAGALLSLGRTEEILRQGSPELESHPLVRAMRGSALIMAGDMGQAFELFTSAADLTAPDQDVLAWVGLTMTNAALMRGPRAASAARKVFALAPPLMQSPALKQIWSMAFLAAEEYEEAWTHARDLPENAQSTLWKALVLEGLKRDDEALRTFDRAIDLSASGGPSPIWAAAWTRKGLLLARTNHERLGLDAFRQVLTRQGDPGVAIPYAPIAALGEAFTLWRLDREGKNEFAIVAALERAAALSEALPRTFPRRAFVWLSGGRLLEALGRDEDALRMLRLADSSDPMDPEIKLGLGRALFRLEDHEAAVEAFGKAATLATTDAERFTAELGRGQALAALERYEDAIAAFREALRLRPHDTTDDEASTWIGLGHAYKALNRRQAALRAFQQGWRLDRRPKRASALAVAVGAELLDQGRDADARQFLTEALERAQPDGRIDYNLGIACYRLRDRDGARHAWNNARDRGFAPATESLAKLPGAASGRPGAWLDYWFADGLGWYRRGVGTTLIGIGILVSLLPLIKPGSLTLVPWLHTGQAWNVTGISLAVVLLLLAMPTLTSLSIGPVKLEATPSHAESAPSTKLQPDELLATLRSIGVTPTTVAAVRTHTLTVTSQEISAAG